ncbi:MAG: (Fe-S)-binding protein [Actinomycetia bacterium]|nr:(Fe-S)-binding protein [Actinomycetes bacterium]
MTQQLSTKPFYAEQIVGDQVPLPLVRDCYAVFACRHKFCREVCPVYQDDRNESHTSYGYHTAVLGIAHGFGDIDELHETITNCLECGGCETRCPNTLFAGDFYGTSTTTVNLVRKIRRDLVAAGTGFDGAPEILAQVDKYLGYFTGPVADLTKWADGLELPFSGATMLFVDYFNAFETTDVPRNAAKILKAAGVEFGILDHPGATLGELLDVDLAKFVEMGRHNVEALRRAGAKRVILINPHDYSYFTREYPQHLGELGFEVVYITDFLDELTKTGKLNYTAGRPGGATVSYHDPCTLSKICGITASPRSLISQLPGVEFIDVSPVTQWSYCCGKGNASFKALHPDKSYKIGTNRLQAAADLGVDQLVLACPHCKDQLTDVKARSGVPVEPVHVLSLIANALGLD